MKHIITCAAFVAMSFTGMPAHAQSSNAVSANDAILQPGEKVLFSNGTTTILRDNGTQMELQGNVVTGDGKLIKPDGTVVFNGTTTKMENGKVIKADGTVEQLPKIKSINVNGKTLTK